MSQLVKMNIIFDKILNIFKMSDLYLGANYTKNSKNMPTNSKFVKSVAFDVSYISKKMIMKIATTIFNSYCEAIDQTFDNINGKLIMYIAFVVMFGMNPFFMAGQ